MLYQDTVLQDINLFGKPAENWNGVNSVENRTMVFTAYDGVCRKFAINGKNLTPADLFYFNLFTNDAYRIILADSDRSTYYMIHSKSMTGEPIQHENDTRKFYSISFEEVNWLEESGECTKYGHESEYGSYADCVADQHEQVFKPVIGCRVPLFSAPADPRNCQGRLDQSVIKLFETMQNFWQTVLIAGSSSTNACLKPCKAVKAHSTLTTRESYPFAQVLLHFETTVKVVTYHKAYGLFDLVVEVGSSLGLWIGLSALGVYDLLLMATGNVQKCFNIA